MRKLNISRLRDKIKQLTEQLHGEIFQLRQAGETYQSIGDKVGFTRQRVEQICKRMKYDAKL